MRKLNLLSVVRRRRPYTRYHKAVHKYPNLLSRNFDHRQAQSVLGDGYHLYPYSGKYAVHVRRSGSCGKAVLAWKIGSDIFLRLLQIPFEML